MRKVRSLLMRNCTTKGTIELRKLELLKKCLKAGSMRGYAYKEELKEVLNKILNYRELGYEKPVEYMKFLKEALGEDFKFVGRVYRGLSGSEHNITDLYAFTTSEDIAYNFTTLIGEDYTEVIQKDCTDGFNFGEFMNTLCELDEYYLSICEVYLNEEEIWCNLENCTVKQQGYLL